MKIKKITFYLFTFVAIVLLLAIIINEHVKASSKKEFLNMEDDVEQADAILVLGAYVRNDGSLSRMLKERVDTAIELYNKGWAKKIVMSGDHGREDYDEVNVMKEYAIEKGIPSEDIFMDHAGFSTYESAYRLKAIFEVESAIVVTQEYHLYRGIYDVKAFGIDVKGVACDKNVYTGDSARKVREALARVKDFVYTIIKPNPTYKGTPIPISGSGDATND